MCICIYVSVGGGAAGMLCVAIFLLLYLCCEGPLCVFLQEAEMGAASKEAAVRFSPAVNCACAQTRPHARAHACVCLCVQLHACLCSLACAEENRVAMLHLKGGVINEMNKRP